MLDEKRIKEAESNIRQYLQDNMLKKELNESGYEYNDRKEKIWENLQ